MSQGRNGSVLPILTRQVFIEVLNQRKVSLVQSLAEADWDIACLAHQWRCPVLSNDSDFFIFDLPGIGLASKEMQCCEKNICPPPDF